MWAPWQKSLIDKIEKIQCRAAQYVTSDYDSFNSVTLHMNNLKWQTLEDRHNRSRLHNYVLQNDSQPCSNFISIIYPTFKLFKFMLLKHNAISTNVM